MSKTATTIQSALSHLFETGEDVCVVIAYKNQKKYIENLMNTRGLIGLNYILVSQPEKLLGFRGKVFVDHYVWEFYSNRPQERYKLVDLLTRNQIYG